MIKLSYTKAVGAGYAALKDETNVVELPEDVPFLEVLKQARQLKADGAHIVVVISRQANMLLIDHNDNGGYLLLGYPKPNPKSWMVGTWEKTKNYGNNVQVKSFWDEAAGEFRSVAIYAKRVLNDFRADSLAEAEEKHKLLCDTWGKATPSNLKDEAQDCPFWKGPDAPSA